MQKITSVCLIYYVETAADSKKSLGGMKILNMVSKNFTCPPITLKIFRPEISMVVEISTDFDLLSIIEFQIYSFILPILQANLGKILAKMLSNCYISKLNTIYLFLKSFERKKFLIRLTIKLFPNQCLVHHRSLRTNPGWILGPNSRQYTLPYFAEAPA